MAEEWKTIQSLKGKYEASTHGRIRRNGKIIRQSKNRNGYMKVNLSVDNVQTTRMVHRLVAEAFLGEINGMDIDHVDGVKSNNHISNLEIVTRSENIKRAFRIGLRHAKPVLCMETGERFCSTQDAAISKQISSSNLCACLKGRQKTCGNLHWKYAEDTL